jgi:DNA-binding NarL/FixJ family response regulator
MIADDHPIVRQGFRQLISTRRDMLVAAEAGSGQEALDTLKQKKFDLVILDITLPDRSGLDVLKHIKREKPGLPVLVLSVHPENQYAARVIKAGAAGYLMKDSATEELVDAILTILNGKRYISSSLASELASGLRTGKQELDYRNLSDREFSVFRMIAVGKANSEIADQLCISPKTVSTYRSRVLQKLGLTTDAEIVRYAIENGLLN